MSVLTNAPQPYLQRGDRDNFAPSLDDFIKWLCGLGPQLDTFVNTMNGIAALSSYAIPYKFSNQVGDADPGAGYLRLDNANQNAATTIRLDLTGSDTVDYTPLIDTFDLSTSPIKGRLRLTKRGDMTKFLIYNVTAKQTTSGYRNLSVTFLQGSATNPFADGDDVLVTFQPTGNQGVQGPAGNSVNYIAANGAIAAGNHYFTGNYSVTLPDLTSGQKLVLTSPSNASSVPATVTCSDGWTVTTSYAAGTLSSIMPLRTDTAHGWWGSLAMSPPKIGTPVTLGGSGTAPFIQSSVQLSATCVVLAVGDTSSGYTSLVAVDPTTGTVGNVVSLTVNGSFDRNSLFSIGTSGFVFVFNDSTGKAAAYAGTLGGTNGLTITGAATNLTATANVTLADVAVQFGTSSTFLAALITATATQDIVAFSVSGTTVTVGTPAASGAPASCQATKIAPLTSTTALVLYPTSGSGTGGGTHNARVLTLSGLTLTAGTVATTNLSTMYQNAAGLSTLVPFSSSVFLYGAQEYTTSSNNDWFLVTVSGTTVTINNGIVSTVVGAGLSRRNVNLVNVGRGVSTSALRRNVYTVDATHILLNVGGGQLVMASYSGSTLTFSSATSTTYATFLTDVTGANLYGTQTSSGTTFAKLTFSAGAVTVGTAVAAWPSSIINDNLNDGAVNYGGTWYKWAGLPAAAIPLANDKYINLSGTTLTVYGSFA